MEKALSQILHECTPERVILFAEKRTLTNDKLKSLSFCIVVPSCEDKSALMQRLYLAIDSNVSINLTLYTHDEWTVLLEDPSSYAAWIGRRGRIIYEPTT
ncbi:MAG: hypothetical protein HFH26_09310 [Clostridiaceae bacterium]|nr:hypothetical protein [Clostridiaceae bacterium]